MGHEDPRSKAKLHPPPPALEQISASGALGDVFLDSREGGVHRRRREAMGGGGGYCCASWSWAAVTLARSGATVATWTCAWLCSTGMRKPGADICPATALACACHVCAPAKRNRVPVALPPPPPLSHRALGLALRR